MDGNENLNTSALYKALTKLKLRDLVRSQTDTKDPSTRFTGKHQIDGVFISTEIDCTGAIFIPFWSGIGDQGYQLLIYPPSSI